MESKTQRTIKRGDIFYYDFGETEGSIQSGRRPVLVIQADGFNAKSPTVIIASITAVIKKRYLPSHIILGERYGLSKPSMVLLEQIRTVNKVELNDYVGTVDEERMWKKINIAIKKTFGLWFTNLERTGDIRCLCLKCLHDYISNPNYVVRRLDPFAPAKDKCDKCNKVGWDYIIFDRRNTFGKKEGQ
ncbi:MAG: type II toxin-antitoxin system PemK/MazF family toxin [Clostridia bacterium]|nr:type II toxin-antitoxin system PemK/MazF family toxin [Clostridia bacterium]